MVDGSSMERGITIVSALDDVQRHTGDANARAAGHKGQYSLFII